MDGPGPNATIVVVQLPNFGGPRDLAPSTVPDPGVVASQGRVACALASVELRVVSLRLVFQPLYKQDMALPPKQGAKGCLAHRSAWSASY